MNAFFKDIIVEASQGIPMLAAMIAQRYGIQIPLPILEKLPAISEKIPIAITEYQNRSLSGAEKAAGDLILKLSADDLKRVLEVLFTEQKLGGLARATVEGMLAAIAIQTAGVTES